MCEGCWDEVGWVVGGGGVINLFVTYLWGRGRMKISGVTGAGRKKFFDSNESVPDPLAPPPSPPP